MKINIMVKAYVSKEKDGNNIKEWHRNVSLLCIYIKK
jgi:hypothetical protein